VATSCSPLSLTMASYAQALGAKGGKGAPRPRGSGDGIAKEVPGSSLRIDVAREARKSKFNEVTNKVRCLACSRYFQSYSALEAHLTAKHGGLNSKDARDLASVEPSPGTSAPAPGRGKQKRYQDSFSLTEFLRPRPAAGAGQQQGGARGKWKRLDSSKGGRSPVDQVPGPKGRGRGKMLVLNTNLASGDRYVVRRSKERVSGKKQKVSKVKLGVLLVRSSEMIQAAEKRGETIRTELEAKRKEVRDLQERAGGGESEDADLLSRIEAGTAKAAALDESLAECQAALDVLRAKYEDLVDGGAEDKEEEESEGGEGKAQGATVRCEICNVECPNQAAYEDHCAGKLHKSKQFLDLKSSAGKSVPTVVREEAVGPLDSAFRDLLLGDLLGKDGPPFQNRISKELNACVTQLVERLLFLQKRAYRENPTKNKSRKRAVFGLNEVRKSLKSKCKALILVPNIETGVPDIVETTKEILRTCAEREVRVVFALSRSKLGRLVKRGVRMSMCSVLDYSGCEDLYKKMLQMSSDLSAEGAGAGAALGLNPSAPLFVPSVASSKQCCELG